MQPPNPARDVYPHRELGIVLLVLGVLLMVFAVIIGGVCQTINSGPGGPPSQPFSGCIYPYGFGAAVLGAIGLIFLILGIILVALRNPPASPLAPYTPFPWYPFPPPPPPPLPQLIACKNCGRVYPLNQFSYCPVCGSKIGL